jgi:hypothetical protein
VGIKQGGDDRALGNPVTGALCRHLIHPPLETTQVGDLAANLGKVLHSERMDFRAGKGVSINQPQQDTQLIEVETEFAATVDEGQPFQVVRPKDAVSARVTLR